MDCPPQLMQERYRTLLQAARRLFFLTNLDDVIEQILKLSLCIMQAEACSMYLADPKAKELVIYSARGTDDVQLHAARIPWDRGIAGEVYQTRTMIRVDDAQNDPRLLRVFDSKTGFVTRSILGMPLLDRNDCFGVLQAINPVERPIFSANDQEILEGLTGVLTSALIRLEREKRAVDQARFSQELEMAHEIQSAYLPPPTMTYDRAEFHVKFQPARAISGDFYTAFGGADGKYLFATGDVSGKGIPAALTTAQVTGEINALIALGSRFHLKGSLEEWVQELNRNLCGRLAAGRFVAVSFLMYDPAAAEMRVCCAGQFAPWHLVEGDVWKPVVAPTGLPLGVFKDAQYTSVVVPCQPGDKWMMFSDGINEGRNAADEEFGVERLRDSLQPGSPARVLEKAWEAWKHFSGDEAPHDDACLMIVGCRPPALIEFTSEAKCCRLGRNFVEDWGRLAGLDDLARGQLVLAVDEAVTNIIRHTYQGAPSQKIQLHASLENGALSFRLRDFGPPLDLEKVRGRDLEDVRPGGLGIPLLKMTFQNVEYVPREPGTELVLQRSL